ncbi:MULTISPECIES: sulfotransferase [Hyphobacterium]|uniref:Sulfotransferase n=1 Tax=Hyphobacterium vulgare TaxID=1736751 RepID=A0ABV6ZYL1_9PROT
MSEHARRELTPSPGRGDPLAILDARFGQRHASADIHALEALFERSRKPEPARPLLRMINHMACTGGTLIARGLNAQPNTLVLSEVDPLSSIQLTTMRSRFAPTDPILLARVGLFPVSDEVAVEMFQASVDVLLTRLDRQGRGLVLRGHAHSQFCTEQDWAARPTLFEMFSRKTSIASVVTVRDPLDSWLSLIENDWRHFDPFSIDEYARRYHAFLDRHAELPCFKYENFVNDPDAEMRRMCEALELRYNSDWRSLISAYRLSGDSGRRGDTIAPRPRREVPDALLEQAGTSSRFVELCDRLEYHTQ